MQIIIHIDERQKWPMVLSNLKHLNEFYPANAGNVIELLANGDAVIDLQKNESLANSIQTSLESHNQLVVCQNSLNQRAINSESIIASAHFVPSGVVELVQKQDQGFKYLRP